MTPQEQRALRLLADQWANFRVQLERLSLPDARPSDPYQIFSLIEHPKQAGQIAFNIKPVLFNVPERAYGSADMYIAAQGRIYLDEESIKKEKALKTVSFATEVGYFRKTKDGLDHVYGAHYDFSLDEIGHPVFHAQLKSYNNRGQWISDAFQLDCQSQDLMKPVLRTVRLPTAQMDFFALVVQICADHLISKNSGNEEKQAFADLRAVNRAIQGTGHLIAHFADAVGCMRAPHWYSG